MSQSDIGFRHIVDVDGQLLAIDAVVVDAAYLLARANRPIDGALWWIRTGERIRVSARQPVILSPDEVFFFESRQIVGSSSGVALLHDRGGSRSARYEGDSGAASGTTPSVTLGVQDERCAGP